MKARIAIAAGSVGALVAAALVTAGPLNPPAGPVAPTYKTLAEVAPRTAISAANTPGDATSLFIISQPGSYYLTGNITGVSGKCGVSVRASHVSIDLNGFALAGVPGATSGVVCPAAQTQVEVRNGAARNWPDSGVHTNLVRGGRLHGLRLAGNFIGARAGIAFEVSDCAATDNTAYAFLGGENTLFRACTVNGNDVGAGFDTASGCSFLDCVVTQCTVGIYPAFGAFVTRCAFYENVVGLQVYNHTRVTGCSFASLHANAVGIRMGAASAHAVIQDNSFSMSGAGSVGAKFAGTGHVLVRNQFTGCTTDISGSYSADEILGPMLHPLDMFGAGATETLNPWANLSN